VSDVSTELAHSMCTCSWDIAFFAQPKIAQAWVRGYSVSTGCKQQMLG